MALKEKERAVYDYIIDTIKRRGYSPSVRDIQTALGIKSTSTVHSYLNVLEHKGYIQKEQGKSRTIRVDLVETPTSRRSIKVPILGQVAAGVPILAEENHEGYVDFPLVKAAYASKTLYALNIRGESMIEEGIMDGDIVVVEKRSFADNGEIVVAMIDDEATVKYFYQENGVFRLQPANSSMKPIIVREVAILGVVIACLRFY
ncbi:MAG: transcriptional repressor LexA [Eubacteriales bacterium]